MIVTAIIEIPAGSQNKYEYDHKTHRIRLDRVLYSPFHYPAEYGFVPETEAEDGDPIDIIVLLSQPTFPGCELRARLIGLLEMEDDKGLDDKLLAVAADDPRYETVTRLEDVSPHTLREIAHFFGSYKELEGKTVKIDRWLGEAAAAKALESSRARWRLHHR
jgi:inorganic pyrophosphatase